MHKTAALICILLGSMPAILWAGTYQMTSDRSTCHFQRVENFILIQASVNDIEGNFLLDTGAEELTLNEKIFDKPTAIRKDHTMLGIGAVREGVSDFFVKEFRWAALRRKNFLVMKVDLSRLERSLGQPILGLIGYNTLRGIEIQIDFIQETIDQLQLSKEGIPISASPESHPDYSLSFKKVKYLPVIDAFMGNQRFSLMLDSGAASSLMDIKHKKALESQALQKRKVHIAGLFSKPREVSAYTLQDLNIDGQLNITFWHTTLYDLAHLREHGLYIDGIVSLSFFRFEKISLNYKRKQLCCWGPIQNFDKHLEQVPSDSLRKILTEEVP